MGAVHTNSVELFLDIGFLSTILDCVIGRQPNRDFDKMLSFDLAEVPTRLANLAPISYGEFCGVFCVQLLNC